MKDSKKQIIFIGNWKTYPKTEKEAIVLYKQFVVELKKNKQKISLCVPSVYIPALSKIQSRVALLGLQNTAPEDTGAYTGEVSLKQIAQYKVTYVLIGHSELRQKGETDELINTKIKYSLKQKVTPVICVGEKVRDTGHEYFTTITEQIVKAFDGIPKKEIPKIIIAYEPVWAIGKNALREATPEEFHEIKILIKKILTNMHGITPKEMPKILYGGSVTEKNADRFVSLGDTDGFLVGRTSLDVKKTITLLTTIS
jgi:triosephosphate isomerase